MEYLTLNKIIIEGKYSKYLPPIKQFLKKQNLRFDDNIEYTVVVYDGEKLVGTGSFDGTVLKCIAVDADYRGMSISNRIVSELINEEYRRGNTHLFVYTKPENEKIFRNFGFYKIEEVKNKVILLENISNGIEKFTEDLKKTKTLGNVISSLVMNCNPFTLGHRYLIEKASKESDVVHLFVIWEERSIFPRKVRYELVKEGVKDFHNVILHRGGNYIISNATFPSYFINNYKEVSSIHLLLDVKIFGHYIVPVLGINRRYAGGEPFSNITKKYNEVMNKNLIKYGVHFIEVPRVEINNQIVSASEVRKLIKEDKMDEVKKLVPYTTYKFLVSDRAKNIIQNIKIGNKNNL